MKRIFFPFFLGTTLLTLSVAHSQNLNLAQAVELALKNNNALTLQRHQQQLYALAERQQAGQFLPTASAGATVGSTYQLADWSRSDRRSASISVNEKLDLSLWPSLSAAEADTREAQLRFKRYQQTLTLTVAQSFLNCLGLQEKTQLSNSQLAYQRLVLGQIIAQAESGLKTRSEVYQQESSVAQAVADSVQSAHDLSDALQTLADLLNSDTLAVESLVLTPIDLTVNPAPPTEYHLQQSTAYLAQLEKIQAAQYSLQAARWNYFPTLALGATLAHDRSNTLSWSASLNFTIFDGRTRSTRVARSKVNLQSAQIELAQQEQELNSLQKSALRKWQNSQSKLQALSYASEAASKASSELEVRYQLGAATQLELQQSQNLWQNAEIARIDANLSAINAYLNAMDAMGQLATALAQLTGSAL